MSGAEIPAIIGAVATVAGAAYQASEQSAAQKRMDQARTDEALRQDAYQKQIDSELSNTMQTLQSNQDTPQTIENYGNEQQNAFKAIVDNIDISNPGAIMGTGTAGKQSDAYISRLAENKSKEISKAAQLAKLLGKVSGPGQSMLNRSLEYSNSGLNLMQPNNFATRSGSLLPNELAVAGRTNDLPGAVLSGVGAAGLSGAFDSYFKPSTPKLTSAATSWKGTTAYSPIPVKSKPLT